MLDGDLSATEYKEIKSRLTPEIEKLNRQLADTNAFDSSYNTYVADGVSLLENLSQAFIDGDLYTKHQIIGSIFPEKLIFENNQYRTIRLLDSHARMLSEERSGFSCSDSDLRFLSGMPWAIMLPI